MARALLGFPLKTRQGLQPPCASRTPQPDTCQGRIASVCCGLLVGLRLRPALRTQLQ